MISSLQIRQGPLSALLLLPVFASICSCGPQLPPLVSRAPHSAVIFFDIDTLRADHLGTYGYHLPTSPVLDRWAETAVLFETAIAQAPYTLPSQMSIVTGLYPTSHGLRTRHDRLAESVTTLAERLVAAGYRTAAFVDGGNVAAEFGFSQGFEVFDDSGGGLAATLPKAEQWLASHADQPFFLWIHTYDVHTPYAPAPKYRSMFAEGMVPKTPGFEPTGPRYEALRKETENDEVCRIPREDLDYAMALYDAEIREVDDRLAGFLAFLEAANLESRAAIYVFSDHGEEFGEHGSVMHDQSFATVVRVPLIVRVPGQEPRRVRRTVQMIDIAPTVLDGLGLPAVAELPGRSLFTDQPGANDAFGENPYQRRSYLFENRLHLLFDRHHPRRLLLYDFDVDPLEQHDLADQRPADVERLGRELGRRLRALPQAPVPEKPSTGPPPEVEKQLRALGYL